jgi:uncharacterized protein YcbK (DUF882 family)
MLSLRSARAGYCCGIAALLVVFGCESLQNAAADGETRTISFHHLHTKEDLTVTYKRHGRYDEQALKQINHLMRDWREQEPIRMDPHLIDLLWEVHREVGAREPIAIVCGYRSAATNSKLRRRSSGVAKFSLHMQGRAIDFHIPGVALEEVQAAGLRAQRGGVGIYPGSGFVHMDTGGVRHWPRMPEAQLARVMAKGQLASRSASDERRTIAVAHADSTSKPGFLSKLFGARNDEVDVADRSPAAAKASAASRMAAAAPASESRSEKSTEKPAQSSQRVAAVPIPPARPVKSESFHAPSATAKPAARPGAAAPATAAAAGFEMASASSKPVRPAQAASQPPADASANDIINARGYWQGLPGGDPTPQPNAAHAPAAPPAAPPRRAVAVASAAPAASTTPWPLVERSQDEPPPNALAYAAQPTPIAGARTMPMGLGTPRAAAPPGTTIAVKRSDDRPSVLPPAGKIISLVRVGDRFDDPWMRAMVVSPSAQIFMRTTRFGATDFRDLGPYMHKPANAVAMTFTGDPHLGMICEKFAGSAVVFVSTITFGAARTAALR